MLRVSLEGDQNAGQGRRQPIFACPTGPPPSSLPSPRSGSGMAKTRSDKACGEPWNSSKDSGGFHAFNQPVHLVSVFEVPVPGFSEGPSFSNATPLQRLDPSGLDNPMDKAPHGPRETASSRRGGCPCCNAPAEPGHCSEWLTQAFGLLSACAATCLPWLTPVLANRPSSGVATNVFSMLQYIAGELELDSDSMPRSCPVPSRHQFCQKYDKPC